MMMVIVKVKVMVMIMVITMIVIMVIVMSLAGFVTQYSALRQIIGNVNFLASGLNSKSVHME